MKKLLATLTALFLVMSPVSAANEWNTQEYSSFDNYSELNSLVDETASSNATVIENGSFVSISPTEGVVSLNTSYYQDIEAIDGIKVVTEQKAPLETDITGLFKEALDNRTITAELGRVIVHGENKILVSDMSPRSGYDEPSTFSNIAFEISASSSAFNDPTTAPKITNISFIERKRPVVYEKSNLTVNGSWNGDAFTAEMLSKATVNVENLNESVTMTITGYNSTSETENQSFEMSQGTNTFSIGSFTENTTTYSLEIETGNSSANISELEIRGVGIDQSPSGIAPGAGGGLFTGNFFQGIPRIGEATTAINTFLNNLLTSIGNFLEGFKP